MHSNLTHYRSFCLLSKKTCHIWFTIILVKMMVMSVHFKLLRRIFWNHPEQQTPCACVLLPFVHPCCRIPWLCNSMYKHNHISTCKCILMHTSNQLCEYVTILCKWLRCRCDHNPIYTDGSKVLDRVAAAAISDHHHQPFYKLHMKRYLFWNASNYEHLYSF